MMRRQKSKVRDLFRKNDAASPEDAARQPAPITESQRLAGEKFASVIESPGAGWRGMLTGKIGEGSETLPVSAPLTASRETVTAHGGDAENALHQLRSRSDEQSLISNNPGARLSTGKESRVNKTMEKEPTDLETMAKEKPKNGNASAQSVITDLRQSRPDMTGQDMSGIGSLFGPIIEDDAKGVRNQIREMIQSELQGELGERFSRNLRIVIRREIAAAVDDQFERL